MIKSNIVRFFSVILVGSLALGCGSRTDGRPNGAVAQAPAACVPPPADTLKAPQAVVAPTVTSVSTTAPFAIAPKASKEDKSVASSAPTKAKTLDAPLKIRRLVVSTEIARGKREPVGEKAAFKASELDKVYAFVEVENPTQAESEVFVTFEPAGQGASEGQVTLRVGASPRWRTWAFTRNVKKAGTWNAVVRNADGKVLARTPFEVTL